MTRFRNRIAVWSSLHEPVLIYGSSHASVFESPVVSGPQRHESESSPGLLKLGSDLTEQTRNAIARNQHIQINIDTRYTDMCTQTHTCTPTHTHIQVYIYTYIILYIHTHPLNTHTNSHTHTPCPCTHIYTYK